jgi:hypothetical protein
VPARDAAPGARRPAIGDAARRRRRRPLVRRPQEERPNAADVMDELLSATAPGSTPRCREA